MRPNTGFSRLIDGFAAVAGAIGRQRHLGAVRDGFVTIMPLMIAGSLFTLINRFPIGTGADGGRAYLVDLMGEVSMIHIFTYRIRRTHRYEQ